MAASKVSRTALHGLIMRVGLLGGSFDPIHKGHLHLAKEMQKTKRLDEVWFVPTRINPLKVDDSPPASSEHRLAMLNLALKKYPNFKIITNDIDRTGPSYTIELIRELKREHPSTHFFLVIGEDVVSTLHDWKAIKEITEEVPLLIGTRSHKASFDTRLPKSVQEAIMRGYTPIKPFEVSSTTVREYLEQGKHDRLRNQLPSEVVDYIQKYMLYFNKQ